MSLSNQSEIAANANVDSVIKKVTNYDQTDDKQKIARSHFKKQPNRPIVELFGHIILTATLITAACIWYALDVNSFSLSNFLLHVFIVPQNLVDKDYSYDALITLFFWLGILKSLTVISEVCDFLPFPSTQPNSICLTIIVVLALLFVVLLPLVLLWFVWPFSIIMKILWTFQYSIILQYIYYSDWAI